MLMTSIDFTPVFMENHLQKPGLYHPPHVVDLIHSAVRIVIDSWRTCPGPL